MAYNFELMISTIVVLIIFGILGNTLTLASQVYATLKKKYNFDIQSWGSSTVFIFNLALVDLAACFLTLASIIYAALIYSKHLDLEAETAAGGNATCKFFILGIQGLAQITGWSIALISFVRAFKRYR